MFTSLGEAIVHINKHRNINLDVFTSRTTFEFYSSGDLYLIRNVNYVLLLTPLYFVGHFNISYHIACYLPF